ncbi:hypothetical protein HDU67_002466 [Dinochytrium kinnereticum]|nr:hypothetical protein HDU67_002466 [Dinochytrium kinnereticum]
MSSALERAQAYLRGEKPSQKGPAKASPLPRQKSEREEIGIKSKVGGGRDKDDSDEELQLYLESLARRKLGSAAANSASSSKASPSPYLKAGKSQDLAKSEAGKGTSYLKSKPTTPATDVGATRASPPSDELSSEEDRPLVRNSSKSYPELTEGKRVSEAKRKDLSQSADRMGRSPKPSSEIGRPSFTPPKSTAKSLNNLKTSTKFGDLESDSSSDIEDFSLLKQKAALGRSTGSANTLSASSRSQKTVGHTGSSDSGPPPTSVNPQPSRTFAVPKGQKNSDQELSSDTDSSIGSDFDKYMGRKMSARATLALPKTVAITPQKPLDETPMTPRAGVSQSTNSPSFSPEKTLVSNEHENVKKSGDSIASNKSVTSPFRWPTPAEVANRQPTAMTLSNHEVSESISQMSIAEEVTDGVYSENEMSGLSSHHRVASVSDLINAEGKTTEKESTETLLEKVETTQSAVQNIIKEDEPPPSDLVDTVLKHPRPPLSTKSERYLNLAEKTRNNVFQKQT